jgi:hypothetical protein
MPSLQQEVRRYLEALDGIKQKVAKSCCGLGGTGDFDISTTTNPNLDAQQMMDSEIVMLLQDETKLLADVRNELTDVCHGKIQRFDSCDLGIEGDCLGTCFSSYNIEDSYITYDMVPYVSNLKIPEQLLQCNIYNDRTTLADIALAMHMISRRNTMERAFILGDESIPVGPTRSPLENVLGMNDGILKLACQCTPTCQVIDAGGLGPSRELFLRAISAIPNRYKSMVSQYKFLTGTNMNAWWAYEVSNRPTDKGDIACQTGNGGAIWGAEFYQIPFWPEYMLADIGGTQREVTHIYFTPLSNLWFGTKRQFQFQTRYDLECDYHISVGRSSHDTIITRPEQGVLIKNVDLENCANPWTGCVGRAAPSCPTDQISSNPCPCI